MAVKQLLSQLWEPTSLSIGYLLLVVSAILLGYYVLDLYRNRDKSGVPIVGWISPVQPKNAALWYIFKQKTLLDKAYEKASTLMVISWTVQWLTPRSVSQVRQPMPHPGLRLWPKHRPTPTI